MLLLLRPHVTDAAFTGSGIGPGPVAIAMAARASLADTTSRPQGSASAPKAPQGR